MAGQRGAPQRLSRLQAAILTLVAEGELKGEGGAYGYFELAQRLRQRGTTAYLRVSFGRSLANLKAKGLIAAVPYFVHGAASGHLLALSAKGRALVRARQLRPAGVADRPPLRIDVTREGAVATYAS
jgi:hypothetical protein